MTHQPQRLDRVLLENERVTYGMARDLARQALRELVRELPAIVKAQILVASETALGPVGSVTQN